MSTFDFDRVIDRRGTDSIKYDLAVQRGLPADVLPLWVADMDFPAPPAVVDALVERSRHGIFGYSDAVDPGYADALSRWYARRHGWRILPEWIVKSPGVVFALFTAVRALTKEGDAVLIQEPVYHPFRDAVETTRRKLVVNPLVFEDGAYRLDLVDFERKLVEENVRLFILCSPHNPVGRVWTEGELVALGDACVRHGVTVIADEIHHDLILPGFHHRIFADLKPSFVACTVTCTAPSKTFNLAGFSTSNLLVPDPGLRHRLQQGFRETGCLSTNVLGLVACRAAYEQGEPWLDALLPYFAGNFTHLRDTLAERLPAVRPVELQGTYLAWLDFRDLGLTDEELDRRIVHEAKLWFNDGREFGTGGDGFRRVNLACPRATLDEALRRLVAALR